MGYPRAYGQCCYLKLLTNGLAGTESAICEIDGKAQRVLWSAADLGLGGVLANEVAYGPTGQIYGALKNGIVGYPGSRLVKFTLDRSEIEWCVGVGAADNTSLDDAFSIAITRDHRVLAAVQDTVDTLSEGNRCMMSLNSDGELEWSHTQQSLPTDPSSGTFRPFCVRALKNGKAWFVGETRLVKCDVDGSIEFDLSSPPQRRGGGRFSYGTGDIGPAPDNVLAVILHEDVDPGGSGQAQIHSLLLVDQDGSSAGLVELSNATIAASTSTTLTGSAGAGAMPRGVTATPEDFIVSYPIIGRATSSALTWSVAPQTFGGHAQCAVDGGPEHMLVSESNPFYPSLSSEPFICIGRDRLDGSPFVISALNQFGLVSRNSLERLRVGII